MSGLYATLDPLFSPLFHLGGGVFFLDFGIGLVLLALLLSALGELCMAGVYFINRKHFAELRREMVTQHNNSLRALAQQDKASYKACNAMANEAFGKNFFSGITLFASSIWPAFFALGWLGHAFPNFQSILPLAGEVGVSFFFVPTYILGRIVFHKLKPRLPLFAAIQRKVTANEAGEALMTLDDIVPKKPVTG